MSYDLPFVTNAQWRASKLRLRTEEELDPWGYTAAPQAPIIPTQPTADLTTMAGRIEASRIYGAPEPGTLAAELGLQPVNPFAPENRPYLQSGTVQAPTIPLTPSGLGLTTTDPTLAPDPSLRRPSPRPYVTDPREAELPPDVNVASILDQQDYICLLYTSDAADE